MRPQFKLHHLIAPHPTRTHTSPVDVSPRLAFMAYGIAGGNGADFPMACLAVLILDQAGVFEPRAQPMRMRVETLAWMQELFGEQTA
jgi:hypothetical protein